MLAHVTNFAASARGFDVAGGGIVFVPPGETMLVDLTEHPAHRAWEEAGEITIAPLAEKDSKAMRKRLDARVEAEARMQAEALARLAPTSRI
jgi:hypothetical protein